jgi:hypothetical protein
MKRSLLLGLFAACVGLAVLEASQPQAVAANQPPLPKFYYYPYYYFPHNYWPTASPPWPEPANAPYQRPPAYQAYPPFREQGWRYELFEPMKYYRGHHFWLDVF